MQISSINDGLECNGSSALNREIVFRISVDGSELLSAVELPLGKEGPALTVILTVRKDDGGIPGRILREAFVQVAQMEWYQFRFAPLQIDATTPFWIGFKGVGSQNTGTVVWGASRFIPPFTNQPDARTAVEYVLRDDGRTEGPFEVRPVARLLRLP